jgi:pyruvate kinase
MMTNLLFTYFFWKCRKRVQQRLALYQGVCPVYMEFSDESEETFRRALDFLQVT